MKTVQVKNVVIGEGLPKIAVPVTAADLTQASEQAAQCARVGADLIELRADLAKEVRGDDGWRQYLAAAGEAAGDVPLIFTVRTSGEGGQFPSSGEAYAQLVRLAAEDPAVSLVDIELSSPEAAELIRFLAERGKRVILSRHSFAETPAFGEILATYLAMDRAGGDILKCAFMPKTEADAGRVLAAAAAAQRETGKPVIAISMGEMGRITRVAGEAVHAAVTFGCLPGEASAPGQLTVSELKEELTRIHERRARGNFLFLTGFMGTGKTAAAEELSALTGLPVIEMDETISAEAGKDIPAIFAEEGETHFRDLETQLLASLSEKEPAVVSCGGGCVLREENRALMRALGTVVLLTAEPRTLLSRLAGEAGGRPNLRGRMSEEGIRELMERRAEAYAAVADLPVATDSLTAKEVAAKILEALKTGRQEGGNG